MVVEIGDISQMLPPLRSPTQSLFHVVPLKDRINEARQTNRGQPLDIDPRGPRCDDDEKRPPRQTPR